MEEILVRNGLAEEEICGWRVSSRQKRIWNVLLNITKELLRVCEKHNLTICAIAGTLLGSIRHDGFIPWDDDMDFLMPRDDYSKLLSLSEEFHEPYFLQTTKTENGNWFRGFARLCDSNTTCITPRDCDNLKINRGIFVDIFPADIEPDPRHHLETFIYRQKVMAMKVFCFESVYHTQNEKKGIKSVFLKLLYCIYAKNKDIFELDDKYNRLLSRYNGKRESGFRPMSYSYKKGNALDFSLNKDELFPIASHCFEKIEIKIPGNFDACLKKQYHNYMEFPPKDKRKAQERNIVNPDISYKDYKDDH